MVKILGFKIVERIDRYLGSYVDSSADKKRIGQEIIQKLAKKLQAWKVKMLSQAGRLALCKSVLQSIPIYHLATTKILNKDLEQIMRIIDSGGGIQKEKGQRICWLWIV